MRGYQWDPSAREGCDTLRHLPHMASCYVKRNLSRDLSPIHVPAALYHPVPHRRRCSHTTVSTRSTVSTEPLDVARHFSPPVPGVPTVGLCLPGALCYPQEHLGRLSLAVRVLLFLLRTFGVHRPRSLPVLISVTADSYAGTGFPCFSAEVPCIV